MHFGQGRHLACYASAFTVPKSLTNVWEGDAGKVGSTAGATDDYVWIVAGHFHLQYCLLTDDGLVQQDVVHHRAQGVLRIVVRRRDLHRFRDSDAQ